MTKTPVTLILSFLLIAGCATQVPIYYWDGYSKSLYKCKKAPDRDHLEKHKVVLTNIIAESEKGKKRVPPGIYCEYGYILLQEGKPERALYYFDLEEKTYPESRVFVERLKVKLIEDKEKQK
jgi:hypothetical protein